MTQTLIATPAARNSDPHTSHLAAEAITDSGERGCQQQSVESLVWRYPYRTSAELAMFGPLDRWQIARRLSEIETAGRIKRADARRCTIGSRKALTWVPA